jgi:hypothetical protein
MTESGSSGLKPDRLGLIRHKILRNSFSVFGKVIVLLFENNAAVGNNIDEVRVVLRAPWNRLDCRQTSLTIRGRISLAAILH